MTNSHCLICLGFTEQRFPPGTHICQIFSEDEEREQAFLDFLLRGLQDGERAAGFTDRCDSRRLENHLDEAGISMQERLNSGALTLTGTSDAYFQNGRFKLEQMLERLALFYEESLAQGYSAARVIGEMTPEVEKSPGGERLFEYESRVSLLLRKINRKLKGVRALFVNSPDAVSVLVPKCSCWFGPAVRLTTLQMVFPFMPINGVHDCLSGDQLALCGAYQKIHIHIPAMLIFKIGTTDVKAGLVDNSFM